MILFLALKFLLRQGTVWDRLQYLLRTTTREGYESAGLLLCQGARLEVEDLSVILK